MPDLWNWYGKCTSPPPWATIFFALHELVILPEWRSHVIFYKRFIDDIFGIWVGTDHKFDSLIKDANNFGILKWDFNRPTNTAAFLDLNITIREGKITTGTHQKEGNPYLYITAQSAHPPGMIKGVIFGLVQCYYEQNSDKNDFISSQNYSSQD